MNPPGRWAPRQGLVSSGGWRHLPAVLVAATFVFPLWFMLSGSLREAGLPPPRTPELVPWPLAFGNYERAIELVDLRAIRLELADGGGPGRAPHGALRVLGRIRDVAGLPKRTAGVMVGVSLVALMVPVTALLVSRFALFRLLHLTDTFVPLVAPSLMGTSPFYVLLFYWSFKRVPGELFEASRLAGYGSLRTWWRVAMPLVRPVTVAVAVLAFVFTWSNFIDPLIYLFDERKFTLPLGLRSLAQLDPQNFPLLLAGSVMATAPVVGAFLYVQRHFLQRHRGVGWLGRSSGLTLEGIHKAYGDVVALRGLELAAAEGELLVVLGPSGCGKTTALRVVAGLERPDAGRVLIGERDVTRLAPAKRNASMVFQSYALFPHLTAGDNIGFGLRARRMKRAEVILRVREAAALVRCEEVLDRHPYSSPAGSGSGSRWPGPWPATPTSSCSTSRCRTWTPSFGWRRARRSSRFTGAWARRCSTSPTTRSRRSPWATASPSCAMGRWSRSARPRRSTRRR